MAALRPIQSGERRRTPAAPRGPGEGREAEGEERVSRRLGDGDEVGKADADAGVIYLEAAGAVEGGEPPAVDDVGERAGK